MKFSQYNIVVEDDDRLIIANLKNENYLEATNEDIVNLKEILETKDFTANGELVKTLYDMGFIVDNEIDEYSIVKQELSERLKKDDDFANFMIYTTDQCNFRCIYCPEEHISQRLSKEKWDALYKHVEKKVADGTYKRLCFSFFGGEPLLESKKIIDFLTKIEDLKTRYTDLYCDHKITTNGYLLTPKLYDALTSLDVNFYQITVDGFRETHDKMRPRVDGSGTWDKIVENLKYISSKNDKATILLRTNHNRLNEPYLKEFYSWVNENLKNEKFVLSLNPVGKLSENLDDSLAANLDSEEIMKLRTEIEILNENRSFSSTFNPLSKTQMMCNCARKHSYSLTTDGRIAKCEATYMGADAYVGYLSNEGDIVFDNDISAWWENYELEQCKTCTIYPLCVARSCPFRKVNDPENRSDCKNALASFNKNILSLVKDGIVFKKE